MKIKNLIFDLGGVILNIDFNLTQEAFINLGAPHITTFFTPGSEIELFTAFETGKISPTDFRKHLKALLFIESLSDDDFDAAWNAMLLDLPAKNLDYIKQLSQHYRIFLYSNTNEIHLEEVFKIVQKVCGVPTFADYFEREYYSCRLGMRKPDPTSFQEILRENNLKAEETLFIDDSLLNIAGAESVGVKALHLNKPQELTTLKLVRQNTVNPTVEFYPFSK